jgi:septal ring factor EnvC (AmiA/AmiB activator)
MESRSSERPWWLAARGWRLAACRLTGGCLLSVSVVSAQAPERAHTEALMRRAAERLQALQHEADQLAAQEQTLLGDLRKAEVEREMKAAELAAVDTRVKQGASDLAEASERIRQLEQRDRAERPGLESRLVEIYKLGQGRYLRLLLGTSDLRALGRASRTVATLAELDRRRIAEHQKTLGDLQASRRDLKARQTELEGLRAVAVRAEAAARRAADTRAAIIRDIDRRRDLNAQLAGELEGAQQKLQAALRDLGTAAPTAAVSLPLRPFRGDLPWPAQGAVRTRFGRPAGGAAVPSNGIEIAGPEGAPVHAVHDGVVAFADTFAGFGNLVIIDHGSRAFSLYGNLLEIAVKKGARVERGHAVGAIGPSPTGRAGLYFELRVDGQPVDPLQWLKKR